MNRPEKYNRPNQKYSKRKKGEKTSPERNTRQSKSSGKKKKIEQFKSETQQEMQVMAEI